MLDKLTPEENRQLEIYKKEWEKIALTTNLDADFPRAIKAISELYTIAKHPLPTFVECVDPDFANNLINKEIGNTKDNYTYYHTTLWGQLDAYWISFYMFCRDVMKLSFTPEQSKSLDLWAEVAKSISFWYPFDTHCYMVERPAYINLNERGQFSSSTEPSLGWKSGWALCAIDGTILPEMAILNPEKITAQMIDDTKETEVRRHLINQMGIGKYLKETDAALIDVDTIKVGSDIDEADVVLTRALIKDKHGRHYLVGCDTSTNRVYYMPVDPASTTCEQAHASISGGLKDKDCLANG